MLDRLTSISACVDNRRFDLHTSLKKIDIETNIVIVSFVPNEKSRRILEVCLDSLQAFTPEPSAIWVVDNNSPLEHVGWMADRDLNLVLNRIEPALNTSQCGETPIVNQHPWHYASYANGVAIEIARQLMGKKAKFLFTMHQDTAVCKIGWLSFLKSKLTDRIKAAGVRKDYQRSAKGRLHVLGFLADIDILNQYEINYLPALPEYDAGDKITDSLLAQGFDVFSAKNTVWDRHLISEINPNSKFKSLEVDRSIDDDGDVFFLHLGRGTLKATDRYQQKPGTLKATADEYIEAMLAHMRESAI